MSSGMRRIGRGKAEGAEQRKVEVGGRLRLLQMATPVNLANSYIWKAGSYKLVYANAVILT